MLDTCRLKGYWIVNWYDIDQIIIVSSFIKCLLENIILAFRSLNKCITYKKKCKQEEDISVFLELKAGEKLCCNMLFMQTLSIALFTWGFESALANVKEIVLSHYPSLFFIH